ncbi:MAG: hypothetical protein ACR2OU_18320 [Thermomicrobiales bacterium]
MARNIGQGGGRRGAIRGRTQFMLPSGHYAKRDRKTGGILAIKADRKPFKGVVKEKELIQQDQNQIQDEDFDRSRSVQPESWQGYIAG